MWAKEMYIPEIDDELSNAVDMLVRDGVLLSVLSRTVFGKLIGNAKEHEKQLILDILKKQHFATKKAIDDAIGRHQIQLLMALRTTTDEHLQVLETALNPILEGKTEDGTGKKNS